MSVVLEYAPHGLVGLLVPPANTTVEAEASVLLPPGIGWLAARLQGDATVGMDLRMRQYLQQLDGTLAQMNNAPITHWALAVTGASYFCGAEEEDRLVPALQARLGAPFITTALSVRDALQALGARRLALVSPYPAEVTAASRAYWTSRGFEVATIAKIPPPKDAFHSIYALGSRDAVAVLAQMDPAGADAVVMLGTGMPTLPAILAHPSVQGVPVLSSTLALGWRLTEAVLNPGAPPRAETLRAMIAGQGWGARLPMRLPGTGVA